MKALLTGAAGGLGRAFACECAARGYDILLTDINGEKLDNICLGLKKQFAEKQIRILSFACDIRNPGEVENLFSFAREENFLPDILLNIAGLDYEGEFDELNPEAVTEIINANILGTVNITHAMLRVKPKRRELYILFVSSFAAMQPMPLNATYAASKRFILDFSIALGEELKEQSVYTMALCPSGMPTNEGSIKAIAAQGFWGCATTVKLDIVTRKALDRLLKRKAVYIPGCVNKFIDVLLKFVSPKCAAGYVRRRWAKSLEHRNGSDLSV